MGEKGTGGGRAAPVIAKFQKELLGNLKRVDFDVPEGVVFKRVNARTGRVSGEGCSSGRSYLEAFKKENAPDSCYQKKVDRGLLTQRDNRG
jgi:penicillin-binding protein 1A